MKWGHWYANVVIKLGGPTPELCHSSFQIKANLHEKKSRISQTWNYSPKQKCIEIKALLLLKKKGKAFTTSHCCLGRIVLAVLQQWGYLACKRATGLLRMDTLDLGLVAVGSLWNVVYLWQAVKVGAAGRNWCYRWKRGVHQGVWGIPFPTGCAGHQILNNILRKRIF